VERQLHGAPTDSFLEGPSFDREGNLYVTDIPYGRIFRVSPKGEFELFVAYDGEPNGLKLHRDGRLFVADFRHGILAVDPRTRSIEPWCVRGVDGPLQGVNDLHFAGNGDLYFTDQGYSGLDRPTGRLYRLSGAGKLDCLLDRIPSPNGLVLNPSATAVLLSVTRANAVWRVPLGADGSVFKAGTFIQLSGGSGPDGLALDTGGGLAVAHRGLGSVWIFSAAGEPYVTESSTGTILRARVPTSGFPMFAQQPADSAAAGITAAGPPRSR
jgi:gluconolactonase